MARTCIVAGSSGFLGASFSRYAALGGRKLWPLFGRGVPQQTFGNVRSESVFLNFAGVAHRRIVNVSDCVDLMSGNIISPLERLIWCAQNGVSRFVHIGSASVYGGASLDRAFREEDASGAGSVYGWSKFVSDELLMSVGRTLGVQVVVLRVPMVYGVGAKGNFSSLTKLLEFGFPLPLDAWRQNRRSFLSIINFNSALDVVVDAEGDVSGTYNLTDCEDVSTAVFVTRVAGEFGLEVRRLYCDRRVFLLLNNVFRSRFSFVVDNHCLSPLKFRRVFDWGPVVPVGRFIF
jgi:UDP-glucose 4-epimerase